MNTLIPCIISGGAGTRLWPVSREARPKPFMRLPDGDSLLQKTFRRVSQLDGVNRVITVTSRDMLFSTRDDYRPVNQSALDLDFVLEPCARNTAAAIAAAAVYSHATHGPETQLLVLPADHLIHQEAAFAKAVDQARELAQAGYLVTFGIQPSHAETGYGYIESGTALFAGGYLAARFVEKPDIATAEQYLSDGRFLWNAGMFCFQVSTLLDEMAKYAPEVLAAARASVAQAQQLHGNQCRQCELDPHAFSQAPDISIDYAVMERSDKVAVIPCELGWSDIGSWQSMAELQAADERGNRLQGESILHDVHDCFIDAQHRVVGVVGVSGLTIVDTPDALLITDSQRSQEVKFIAQELKRRGHSAYLQHSTVGRPWGSYSVIEQGPRYKIKRIVVCPGASLSLQMHHHRSEHWIVVSGMAKVVNGEQEFFLDTNQSTFIPAGHSHRLSNPGVIDLVMIEVQSGEYLEEDDIVRFDDIYGRTPAKSEAPA